MLCDSLLVQMATHKQRQSLTQFSLRLPRYSIPAVFLGYFRYDVLVGFPPTFDV